MKTKAVVAIAILIVFALMLASCGGNEVVINEEYVGKYNVTKGILSGIEVDAASSGIKLNIEVSANGKVLIYEPGEDGKRIDEETGSATQADDGLIFKLKSQKEDVKFIKGADGTYQMDIKEEGMEFTLVFEKVAE
ncbi:MAG: hypothetical protein GXZ11_05405 [Tissierellia bacterium]|nr:hypothetical protein [Tissierellia bacterium]